MVRAGVIALTCSVAALIGVHTAAPALADVAAAAKPLAGEDCAEAYGGRSVACHRVACEGISSYLVGTWRGAFKAYVRERSQPGKPAFRPYENTIIYLAGDCFANAEEGESFIVGHRSDIYPAFQGLPAKEETGLLVIGIHADGSRFLRMVDKRGVTDSALIYSNQPAGLSVWSAHVNASAEHPEMGFSTIDEADPDVALPGKRNVVVTLTLGPAAQPAWSGIVAYGSHTRGN